jgi:colicin import membrane protein
LIKNRTEAAWVSPMGSAQGLKCTIQVKLLPTGEVMDAVVVGSSGDPVFDRSAENAVRKASPLPVPQDKILFNQKYRVFNLSFKPD